MKIAIIAGALVLATTAASAQTVDQRHNYQQDRIGQGVASGQLTPGEGRHLEGQQGRIDRTEHRMRARNGGYLTGYQRAKLQHRENLASRNIYNKRHNWKRY